MKKLIFTAVLAATTFMNASSLPVSNDIFIANETSSFIELTETVSLLVREWDYTWTSTCGVTHYTSFPSGWSVMQMTEWISDTNKAECGVRPSQIILADSML